MSNLSHLMEIDCKNDIKNNLDVIYALDTTASMRSWIERSKKTINYISNFLYNQNIDVRFNVIGYKDVCDRKCETHTSYCPISCKESKWVQISGFTKYPNEIITFLKSVSASGGGDCPEDLFGALQIVSTQPWRENAKKVVIVISDAPPHGVDFSDLKSDTPNYPLPYNGSKLPLEIANDLKINNIQVFMLFVELNTLEKTATFLEKNEIITKVSSIVGEPWKFSFIIPDDLTCMAIDTGDDDKILVEDLDNPLSSTFFQLRRGLSQEKLKQLIESCFKSGMKDTMRLILYIRDRIGDIKEKDLGRNAFWILRELDPIFVSKYYKEFVSDVGCVNDLLHLASRADKIEGKIEHRELLYMAVSTMHCYLKYIDTDKGKSILNSLSIKKRQRHYRLKECLNKSSLSRLSNTNNIELPPYFIYKWLPKFGSSKRNNGTKRLKKWERENKFATRLSKLMFIHIDDAKLISLVDKLPIDIPSREIINFINIPKKDNPEREALYREMFSFMRELCETLPIEVPMCARDWKDGVEPSKATSGAQNKYKKCFSRRIPEKLEKTILDRKVKSTTLQGHEMVSHFISTIMCELIGENKTSSLENDFVNSQWDTFFEKNKLNENLNLSFQIDCTGSMLGGTPMPLSLALSLFLLSGQNKYISFESPEWLEVEGKSLSEKVSSVISHKKGIHGDIAKGLELAMSQEVQPSVHFVLTDGRYPRMNLLDAIDVRNKLNKGDLTRVVILNIRTEDDKLLLRKPNVIGGEEFYVISGHSPTLIKLFSSGKGSLENQVRKMLRDKFPLSE
jgi:hypothetical protein